MWLSGNEKQLYSSSQLFKNYSVFEEGISPVARNLRREYQAYTDFYAAITFNTKLMQDIDPQISQNVVGIVSYFIAIYLPSIIIFAYIKECLKRCSYSSI